MRATITAISVAGLMATALPGWSQTNSQQSGSQQVTPGGGGRSGTGVPGQPGSKSGPAPKSNGTGMGTGTAPAGADPSGVKGLPGNKSGPSTKEPGQNR